MTKLCDKLSINYDFFANLLGKSLWVSIIQKIDKKGTKMPEKVEKHEKSDFSDRFRPKIDPKSTQKMTQNRPKKSIIMDPFIKLVFGPP
jgi:hypothetical protein